MLEIKTWRATELRDFILVAPLLFQMCALHIVKQNRIYFNKKLRF